MFRKKEERELLKKLTMAVGQVLKVANRDWTDREISEVTQVPPNRLTEYKNFEKYNRSISTNHFVKLLSGGFITVSDVIKVAKGLTKAEEAYLQDMNFYENAEFRKKIIENKKAGVDPVEAQTLMQDLTKLGIDPLEILKAAKDKK
jgi:hypothetical protein